MANDGIRAWKRKRGAYGSVEFDRDARTATKTTKLFDAYDKDDDRYLISGNLREAMFMHQLVCRPLQGVVSVKSVKVDESGQIRSTMEMGDFSLHDQVLMLSFRARMHKFDDVFRDVLLGLCAMHDTGVVHGDVKPDNIVRVTDPVSQATSYKLVDFGGVCWYRDAPKHTSLCTYVTRAPELFDEQNIPSPISDAWSIGATMYFYCTRSYLVDDVKPSNEEDEDDASSVDTIEFVARQHRDGVKAKFPKGVPPRVKELIRKLLHPDPSTRLSCRDCLTQYFGFQAAGYSADEYSVDHSPEIAKVARLYRSFRTSREEEVVSRVRCLLAECNETDCLSTVLAYLKAYVANFDGLTDAEVRTMICAAHALARALVFDEDTDMLCLDEATLREIPTMLRETGLTFPSELVERCVPQRRVVISIDGNIGSSKSTVLARLRERLGRSVHVVTEPVADWKDLLTLFYSDPGRWCLALHTRILTSFLSESRRLWDNRPILLERSAWSCVSIFQSMMFQDGSITGAEHDVVMSLYESMMNDLVPNVVVYLRCDPEVCMQRMKDRDRSCESNVSMEYLLRLHDRYDAVMGSPEHTSGSGVNRVITIDTTYASPEAVEQKVFESLSEYIFA